MMIKNLICALLIVAASCVSPGTLPADDNLDLVEIVVQRYGSYVEDDADFLGSTQVDQYLKDGNAFLSLFQSGGEVSAKKAMLLGYPVMSVHDDYVSALEEDPLRLEVFLGDTALLRDNIEQALGD